MNPLQLYHLPLCLSSSSAHNKICKNPSKTVWDIPTLIMAARNKHTKLSNRRRKNSRNRKTQLPSTQKREIFLFRWGGKPRVCWGMGGKRRQKTKQIRSAECSITVGNTLKGNESHMPCKSSAHVWEQDFPDQDPWVSYCIAGWEEFASVSWDTRHASWTNV